jgi:DNA polymerase elongation subunit (family B)
MIRKILINSIYGVLCNRFFHFYDLDNAANVTGHGREAIQYISNCINDYFSNHFYKVAHKYYPNHKLEANSIPKRIVFVNDTDSAYIWFEHIYNLTNSGESFLEWTLNFEKIILQPFLTKCMDIYAKKYNTENLINFKREKIILKQYVQGKKKYATQIIANEKIVYDTPVLKVTGIEINRSDLCQYSRKKLKKLLDIMMAGDEYSYPNKDDMLEYIRSAYKEFKSQSIQDISAPKGINGYNKYDVVLDETFSNFKPHTPMHNKASMIYNFIIKKEHLPYMEINDGTKMKYVFVNPRNKYKTNVIGYVGNYPKEFQKIFKIDYDEQFEKQFKAIGQRMFDVLDFGEITLKDSKIMSFIEEE